MSYLGVIDPAELGPAFSRFAEDQRTTSTLFYCLDRLACDLADRVGDSLSEALRMTRDVGGTELDGLSPKLSRFLPGTPERVALVRPASI